MNPERSSYRDPVSSEKSAPRRSFVKFDRYALFDVGRKYRLDDRARWMLATLCFQADFRTHALHCTISELSEWTGTGRNTIQKILNELKASRLIEITFPFGPNRMGEVSILAWDQLIVETRRREVARAPVNLTDFTVDADRTRPSNADDLRVYRGESAENCANDQEERPFARERGGEDVRVEGRRATKEGKSGRAGAVPPRHPTVGYFIARKEADRAEHEKAEDPYRPPPYDDDGLERLFAEEWDETIDFEHERLLDLSRAVLVE